MDGRRGRRLVPKRLPARLKARGQPDGSHPRASSRATTAAGSSPVASHCASSSGVRSTTRPALMSSVAARRSASSAGGGRHAARAPWGTARAGPDMPRLYGERPGAASRLFRRLDGQRDYRGGPRVQQIDQRPNSPVIARVDRDLSRRPNRTDADDLIEEFTAASLQEVPPNHERRPHRVPSGRRTPKPDPREAKPEAPRERCGVSCRTSSPRRNRGRLSALVTAHVLRDVELDELESALEDQQHEVG